MENQHHINGEAEWDPLKEDYISVLNWFKSKTIQQKVYGDYRLGLGATEYAN